MLKYKVKLICAAFLAASLSLSLVSCEIPYVSQFIGTNTSNASKDKASHEFVVNNTGISFSGNKISVGGGYVYVANGNELDKYDESNKYSKSVVVSSDAGDTIINPIVYTDMVYYLDKKKDGKTTSLKKFIPSTGENTVVMDNVGTATRIYYDQSSVYMTVPESADTGAKFDLIKLSVSTSAKTVIDKDVVCDNLYISGSILYYEKADTGKNYLWKYDSSTPVKLFEIPVSPFIIVKGEVYFIDGYDYIKTKWSSLTSMKSGQPSQASESTTSSTALDMSTSTASTGYSKIYGVSLSEGYAKSEVYTKAPVGLLTATEDTLFFSNLYTGNFRGIIRLSLSERKGTMTYKEEDKLTALVADAESNKVYCTFDGVQGFTVMSATGADVQKVQ